MPRTKTALLVGFGGLLILILVLGIGALSVFRRIQVKSEEIRQDYVLRNRLLEQVRSDVFLSGTYVRDFLLEPNPSMAEIYRRDLEDTRFRIDSALGSYRMLLRPDESNPLRHFREELTAYWVALQPIFQWSAEQRRQRGYRFLRDDVFRRRMTMLSLADQIARLNEQQLSTGSRNVEALFRQFQNRLLISLLLILGIGVLLAAFSMKRILHLERESEQQYRELLQTRTELKELSARLVEAQETERRTISRELHDEVGQSLSALLLGLGNLSPVIHAPQDSALNEQFLTVRQLAERSMAAVRNMSLLLRPSMLDDLGLIPALQWQAREVSRNHNIRVNVAAEGELDDLPEEHKTCIYRVVQEALHNCARHSEAKSVRISVKREEDLLLLSIQDDGKGFSVKREKGLGLLGMEERVTHLHGSFRVESKHEQGTLIAVTLPLAERVNGGEIPA